MAKYLLLKHYRGAPEAQNGVPMDQWTPQEVDAHIKFMGDFAGRLQQSGELVDGQALAPDGMWVTADAGGQPVTDGPFAETKDLIAGWYVIDVDSQERAVELAAGPGRRRQLAGQLEGPLVAVDVDDHPAGDQVLGLGERAIRHRRTPLAVMPNPHAVGR